MLAWINNGRILAYDDDDDDDDDESADDMHMLYLKV